MWTCHLCNRDFRNTNQIHYCGDQTVNDFLAGKTEVSLSLFDHLLTKLEEIGSIKLFATKSMIAIAAAQRFAYIINIGKAFIDVVLVFKEPYEENYCFRKIAQVPGTNDYNHHLRIMYPEDINEEVMEYLKKAYENGKNL